MHDLQRQIHVNIPFRMLFEGYLPRFTEKRLNPEIGFDAEALERYTRRDFQSVSEELHRCGLDVTIHFPFMDLSPGSPDPRVRELAVHRFGQMTALIPLFKPKAAVCHSGYDSRRYGHMRGEWLRYSLSIWPEVARKAQEQGCPLMMENVYEDGPADLLELIEPLKEWGVGFCLDTGHQAVFGGAPALQWIDSLSAHLHHLHLHDNEGVRDDHMALGSGSIDFEPLFREMKRLLPAPPRITLEPHREEDVLPSLRFLERVWPW